MSKKRGSGRIGNHMTKRFGEVIGDPNGNREQRRAAARLAKRNKRPSGFYQAKS